MTYSSGEHGSKSDPHRFIYAKNQRANALKPVSGSIDSFLSSMPEEVRSRILVERRIEKVQSQFAEVVDPFILRHVNSVYLLKSKSLEGMFDLVVYLDNSTCAAELNARRELIRLKYRERFDTLVDVFEIRISKGRYREQHPFCVDEPKPSAAETVFDGNSEASAKRIDELTAKIEDPALRNSFKRAMAANERLNNSKG